MRPAVFLDRDGVLNMSILPMHRAPWSMDELVVTPGAEEACRRLRERGFILVVITNQPDVVRGGTTKEVVYRINRALRDRLPLDAIYVCFHDDVHGCDCRKPKPGLLLRAANDLELDLARSFMVGDRAVDIEAGRRTGCRTIFVQSGANREAIVDSDFSVPSVVSAADAILATTDVSTR